MNVTPLVDVVLVLLIIFMVVTPQMGKSAPADLPGIFFPDPEAKSLSPVEITIAKDGSLSIEKTAFDLAGLSERLKEIHAGEPERRAVLRGDRSLDYHEVKAVFAKVKEVGFPGVSLLVAERAQKGEESHGN
jgi:biopolymer transport protein ExbD/biopolymer transport protein TolR